MNNYDIYIPIDIKGPIKTASRVNIQRFNNNNPVIMFQLFDGPKPLMLDDISDVAIAFTNTNNESVTGSGSLQVVNPHRGTVSYEMSNKDITMSGLHTVTLRVTTNDASFTTQTTVFSQDISDSLNDALNGSGNGSGSNSGNNGDSTVCNGSNFPCNYYNVYCRICRRCKWVWENNTFPKPVCFAEIKMCKNPFIFPPVKNYANMEGYENSGIPTTTNSEGYVVACIDDTHYVLDIGHDGAVYLVDKTQEVPYQLIGLYMGPKLTLYYKTSEKLSEEPFDVNSLFK